MILCVFNPEHDLCLANGGLNFMAPRSALKFAEKSAVLMQVLYGKNSIGVCAEWAGKAYAECSKVEKIVAWGWNKTLKNSLLKQGIPNEMLPTDERIETIRNLSHRTTTMPIANELNRGFRVAKVESLAEVNELLKMDKQLVMKAPWSGSGRGLRWVSNQMTQQDENWAVKMIRDQRCIMVEKRHQVVQNFALEYRIGEEVEFMGYSCFETLNGVYRGNRLWNDEDIENHLAQYISIAELNGVRARLEEMLKQLLVGKYEGMLGVDMMVAEDDKGYYLVSVVEINFRHTMGMVAHRLASSKWELYGELWSPEL